ncbi:abscisate beta-glucosyltransferase-like [Carica papaya]|uniref:abscisate beta-glucosyltransferase-like n=1 Tax=Carica papaya TaxID=3649 RepID=UPI000B8D055A|nr:abscisate beta-glucosyltransferase-like [Carica papaya]
MELNPAPVEIFFFPFVGGGHQIPMIDMARTFASHGVKATIIATPNHALSFESSIRRDQNSGCPISIHTLQLPGDLDISDVDMSASPQTDTSMLQEPLTNLLRQTRPDCIVHDMFHRWAPEAIDDLGIPRIVFNGSSCFARCVIESLSKYKPQEEVGSDFKPFVVPGLPDPIVLTRSQLPVFRKKPGGQIGKPEEKSFGVLVNSFHELELEYADHLKRETNKKTWLVGPVSVNNRTVADKTERGKKTSTDEQTILSWLDGKSLNSVLYISFGSLARLALDQLTELAHGLEASDHPFIWVVGKIFKSAGKENNDEENFFPAGFEEKMKESNKGLIIRGWAPQLLILEHESVGGFMTHCGWNSTLEGVCAGVPMITWPITAEQFMNEKLITDVLRTGVKVGNLEWLSWDTEPRTVVGREKVKAAVERLMDGGEKAVGMRTRAGELAEKAKRAVEEGGSSWNDAVNLIGELESCRKSAN